MRIRVVLLVLAALVAGAGGVPGSGALPRASATTGPTAVLKPARYRVDHAIAVLYPGQYMLRSVDSKARLVSAQMAIAINSMGYLQGAATFTGYDEQGHRSSWVALLYNFHLTSQGMVIELLSPLATQFFGRLYLRRTSTGDLVGQISLPRTPYAIAWHETMAL